MKNALKSIIFLYTLFFCSLVAFAQPEGIGMVADNLMDPVTIFSSFVSTVSIAIGACFLFAAFVKYSQHRVNPLAVPISTVVILVVMGVILVALPLIYQLTDSGTFYNIGK